MGESMPSEVRRYTPVSSPPPFLTPPPPTHIADQINWVRANFETRRGAAIPNRSVQATLRTMEEVALVHAQEQLTQQMRALHESLRVPGTSVTIDQMMGTPGQVGRPPRETPQEPPPEEQKKIPKHREVKNRHIRL